MKHCAAGRHGDCGRGPCHNRHPWPSKPPSADLNPPSAHLAVVRVARAPLGVATVFIDAYRSAVCIVEACLLARRASDKDITRYSLSFLVWRCAYVALHLFPHARPGHFVQALSAVCTRQVGVGTDEIIARAIRRVKSSTRRAPSCAAVAHLSGNV